MSKIPELLKEVKKTTRAMRGLRQRVDDLERTVHNLILEGKEAKLVGEKRPWEYPFPQDIPPAPGPYVPRNPPIPQRTTITMYGCPSSFDEDPSWSTGKWVVKNSSED